MFTNSQQQQQPKFPAGTVTRIHKNHVIRPIRPYGMMTEVVQKLNKYAVESARNRRAPDFTPAALEWNRLDRERHALEMLERDAEIERTGIDPDDDQMIREVYPDVARLLGLLPEETPAILVDVDETFTAAPVGEWEQGFSTHDDSEDTRELPIKPEITVQEYFTLLEDSQRPARYGGLTLGQIFNGSRS